MDVNKSVSTLMDLTCVPVEVAIDFYMMATAVQVNYTMSCMHKSRYIDLAVTVLR